MKRTRSSRGLVWLSVATVGLTLLSACSSGSKTTASSTPSVASATNKIGGSINVLMVNNPQMLELETLTAKNFTAQTGITVHFVTKVEQDMRDTASTEFANQAGQYDVATLSNFEIPYYAKAGWLAPMTSIANDPTFDQSDILPSMSAALTVNNTVYGEPFYGESSFLMYRKDILTQLGITMPSHPTWAQVAAAADKVTSSESASGMKGICLRGLPGWGDNLAPLTTVVNTMGGTWFDTDWKAQVNTGGFKTAANFYVDLIKKDGEPGAATYSYPQCLAAIQGGKTAMWYDSTAAAGSLEAADSPVKGKIGYADAPTTLTKQAGWLYTWAWAIEKGSKNQAQADAFVDWASSKAYEQLVMADTTGKNGGPTNVPAGKRKSTYLDATYLKSASAFATEVSTAIANAPASDPGTQPRPYSGIQFVGIPSFTGFGLTCAQDIASAISGSESTDSALNACEPIAQTAGDAAKKAAN